ncbi:MAG: hypothetical protein A2Y20_01240 [Firmicutes bacterium GWF2_51_9]|nr:MAG: hypothetical protein A2Y20_01240 [Firmicutes bacterium GWF2_51_9]OGS58368.1 MAG: hypothetical protein A2Y19_08595 [Firmicutes bacterium GWE2_51_13]
MPMKKSMFAKCGKDVYIGRGSKFVYENVYLGNHVSIGADANFICGIARIFIHDYVVLGPRVFIIAGSHRIDVVGKRIVDSDEKLPENDQDIIIDEDVWIGANVIILKGVRIGRGSVIAAGSIVTREVLPYSVYAGVPARKIKDRFTIKEIQEHERILEANCN